MAEFNNDMTIKTLAQLLRLQLEHLWESPSLSQDIPPLMVWGAPGLGKSMVIRDLAAEYGVGFIDVRLAQREPVDIRGLPVPKENGVEWIVAAEWPRDPQSKGIILFDELTAADRSLQVAAYEFILDRRLGHLYQVPDGWYICAAGNRSGDRAVTTSMSSALANRFMHVELKEDAESWCEWAIANGIHPSVVAFIRFRPSLLFTQKNENLERAWPTPRSWARVGAMIDKYGNMDDMLRRAVVHGLVGNAAGGEFLAFHAMSRQFDDVLALMRDPKQPLKVPGQTDQKYAFCAAMVYHLWRGTSPDDAQARLDGFFRIGMKLSSDFAAMAMMDAMHSAKKDAGRLHRHPRFEAWSKLHGAAFRRSFAIAVPK